MYSNLCVITLQHRWFASFVGHLTSFFWKWFLYTFVEIMQLAGDAWSNRYYLAVFVVACSMYYLYVVGNNRPTKKLPENCESL